jgi:drug/metabolite transporter (DMT)-like permease
MSPYRASGMLLLAAFLWGAGNVAQKSVLFHIGPLSVVGARCLIAALVIAPLVFREGSRFQWPRADQWPLIAGVIGSFTAATTLYQAAYGHTSVINSGFIVNLCCVGTPLLAWLLFRARPPALVVPSVALSVLGIFLMGGGRLEAFNRGDVFALLAAGTYALWAVLLGACLVRTPRPLYLMTIKLGAAGVICIFLGIPIEASAFTDFAAAWPELLFLGVFSTGIAYSLQVLAQQHVSATVAMVFVSAEAVFGAVFAHVLIGESLTMMTGIGAALVILAIILISIDPKTARFWPRRARSRIRPVLPVITTGAPAAAVVQSSQPQQPAVLQPTVLPVPAFLRSAEQGRPLPRLVDRADRPQA